MKLKLQMLAMAVSLTFAAAAAQATVLHNANIVAPGVIFGNGNINGGFTVATESGVELALRGKLRHDPTTGAPANTFNANGDGTFSFSAGAWTGAGGNASTAYWSVEYSINTNVDGTTGLQLNDLTYAFGLDSDPSQGTSFTSIDVINGFAYMDHAMGDNSSAQCNSTNSNVGCYGVGNKSTNAADYANRIDTLNVAQNSQKAHWLLGAGFDPTVDATYDFYLAAFRGTTEIGRSSIQIIVGQGGAAVVPEPGSLALAGLALAGLGFARRRKAA